MSDKFVTIEDTLGYISNIEESKLSPKYLAKGSENVLIDRQKGFGVRAGFTWGYETGEGTANNVSSTVWKTSTGVEYLIRFTADGEVMVYFGTVDGTDINSWYDVNRSTVTLYATNKMRFASAWIETKSLDWLLAVNHADIIYQWSGGAAVVASTGSGAVSTLGGTSGVTVGGNGYTVGDILTITGGGGTGATIKVLTLGGSNAVATYSVSTVGSGYTAGSGLATTGGTGTGCTVDIASVTTYITKEGTTTWTENRFNIDSSATILNVRTGTTGSTLISPSQTDGRLAGSKTTTTLASIPSGTIAGDLLVQAFGQGANINDGRLIDNIFVFDNQVFCSSDDDSQVTMSSNSDISDYTYSTPRVPGEGALFNFDNTSSKFGVLNRELVIFAGDNRYIPKFKQITVGSTLSEVITVDRYVAGSNQGPKSQEAIIQIDEMIVYVSQEPALRVLETTADLGNRQMKSWSNQIQPDFDNEVFSKVSLAWHKSKLYVGGYNHLFILEWVETSDGGLVRFWQPPQSINTGASVHVYDGKLINVTESIKTAVLFDGFSDYVGAEKVGINATAVCAYNSFGDRLSLKSFDEHYSEGLISANTQISLTIELDTAGATSSLSKVIDGSDTAITSALGYDGYSIGQQTFTGMASDIPKFKFRTIFEMPKEDFVEMREKYSTSVDNDDVDASWSILSRGANVTKSPRKNIVIKQ